MSPKGWCQLISLLWLTQAVLPAGLNEPQQAYPLPHAGLTSVVRYSKSLRFNVHTFLVAAADSGAIRDLTVKAYRGELLLTNFRARVDGAVIGVEVADLDQNRFPELYVYTASDGSGSFGHVYAWQFLPERKADIRLINWRIAPADGYMGHDSLWVERGVLCRKYPVYRPGDANANPTGGLDTLRYRLRPLSREFILMKQN